MLAILHDATLINLANAYVSGMKQDLNLYGDRLNYINAACEQSSLPPFLFLFLFFLLTI